MNVYEDWPKFYEESLKVEVPELKGSKLVYLGIGGSGIPGRLLEILDLPFPFSLFRGYRVKGIDNDTVVISVSNSGTTTETLLATKRAYELGGKIVAITSGGDLMNWAEERGIPVVKIPKGLQTRFSFPYVFVPVVKILKGLGVDLRPERLLEATVQGMERAKAEAERLLDFIGKRFPVFYASKYLPIAERFKQEFNENAKYPAFFGEIPEINHNEIELYSRWNSFAPVVLKSDDIIDESTIRVLNPFVVEQPFADFLGVVAYSFLLAGLSSVELGERNGVKAEVLYNIPKVREATRRLLLGE